MRRLNQVSPGRLLMHSAASIVVYVLCALIAGLCYGLFLTTDPGGAMDGAQAASRVGEAFRSSWAVGLSIVFMLGLIDYQNRRLLD